MAAVSLKNFEWLANLKLVLSKSERGTLLKYNRHNGPLYVQKPFYPEGKDCAHIYLLHPPGGIVSGDVLNIDLTLEANAQSLITTPGAARLYKAREKSPLQQQHIQLSVNENCILEWFPMETILFNHAHAELTTIINLKKNARVMAWEITCFGLPASNEPFEQGLFKQRYRIQQEGKPLFIDNLSINTENKSSSRFLENQAGMQGQTVSGFFILGPFETDKAHKEKLNEFMRKIIEDADLEKDIAVTWINNFCLIRYLGKSAYKARQGFVLLWKYLRPELIKQQACEPRIWFT
jgi:urease accessory protein